MIQTAKGNQIGRFTLEADASNANLLSWYQSFGFNIIDHLPHYYGDNEDGYKMELIFTSGGKKTSNLIVTDGYISWVHRLENVEVTTAEKFISDPRFIKDDFRVFNLTQSYAYQTLGYYVSLLAVPVS